MHSWALCCLAVGLLAHPHLGLRHDGVLYLGQLLRHLQPAAFQQDLFFAFGSQDQFSLYSRLLSPLLAVFSLAGMMATLSLLGQILSLAAVHRLTGLLAHAPTRGLALLAYATCTRSYGGLGIFAVGEDFLTARTLAEPLALWAMVANQEARPWRAGVLALGSAVLHPLMALPVIAVLSWKQLSEAGPRRVWVLTGLLGAGASVLALVPGLGAKLAARYDEQWWAIMASRDPVVMMHQAWQFEDWTRIAWDALVVALGSRLGTPSWSRSCRLILTVSLLGLGSSLILVDGLHSQLATQAQFWRVLWLLRVWALINYGLLWISAWRWTKGGFSLVMMLLAVTALVDARYPGGLAAMTGLLCLVLAMKRGFVLTDRLRMLLGMVSTLVLLLILAQAIWTQYQDWLQGGGAQGWRLTALRFALLPQLVPLFGWLLWRWHFSGADSRFQWRRGGVAVMLLCLSLAAWDRRDPWVTTLEAGLGNKHPFQAYIPISSTVYWHSDLAPVWALLQRSSYYSDHQGAGLLFNRRTAIAFAERRQYFDQAVIQTQFCQIERIARMRAYSATSCYGMQADDLRQICRLAKGLDFVVTTEALSEPRPLAEWVANADEDNGRRVFYLYACGR